MMSKRRTGSAPAEKEKSVDPASVRQRLGGRPIVMIGLMGAGKTAIGRKIAALTGLDFIDSDHEIEEVSRMSIADLFDNYGEEEFRALEMRVISRLLEGGPRVVSTGGGAFMNEETRQAVREHGISVWLKADFDVLMERVRRKQNRPLLKKPDPEGVMRDLIERRYPIYAQADVTVQSRNAPKDQIAQEVIEALDRHLGGEASTETVSEAQR